MRLNDDSLKRRDAVWRHAWGWIFRLATLGLVLIASWKQVILSLSLSSAAHQVVRILNVSEPPRPVDEISVSWSRLQGNCHGAWLEGRLALAQRHTSQNHQAWAHAFACGGIYVVMAHMLVANDRDLAELALQKQPASADSWFWLAHTYLTKLDGPEPIDSRDYDLIIHLYSEGFKRDPYNGLRWREFGDLLSGHDPQAAIEAYLQSCYNGDPGSNGCWRAGLTAEQLGDIEAAISYYRLSRWSGALERANELESKLHSAP